MTTLAVRTSERATSRRSYLESDDNAGTSYASIGAIAFAIALAFLLTLETIVGHGATIARTGRRCRCEETEERAEKD